MEEVDILECESLAVCDAYDGEINVFGQQIQKESREPTHTHGIILLMEEILHHLGCIRPCE